MYGRVLVGRILGRVDCTAIALNLRIRLPFFSARACEDSNALVNTCAFDVLDANMSVGYIRLALVGDLKNLLPFNKQVLNYPVEK